MFNVNYRKLLENLLGVPNSTKIPSKRKMLVLSLIFLLLYVYNNPTMAMYPVFNEMHMIFGSHPKALAKYTEIYVSLGGYNQNAHFVGSFFYSLVYGGFFTLISSVYTEVTHIYIKYKEGVLFRKIEGYPCPFELPYLFDSISDLLFRILGVVAWYYATEGISVLGIFYKIFKKSLSRYISTSAE